MKKIITLSTLLFIVLLTLSACSKNPVDTSLQKSENSKPGNSGLRSRMADFGQPDRQADIRGVVKSITGNEAVILKVEMKGGRGSQDVSSTLRNGNASNTNQGPAVSLNGANSERRAWSGGGAGMQGGGGATDRAAMLARLKAMSTGEETVIIPVGIKMLKSDIDSGTKKRTMVEASLSDIVSDKSITIWLNQSVTDKKVAEFVLIN